VIEAADVGGVATREHMSIEPESTRRDSHPKQPGKQPVRNCDG
jgi:hypothetical protein